MSIHVVRTFVAMREAIANTGELARRLADLEKKLDLRLEKHDEAIAEILRAIRALMTPPEPKRRPIGFLGPPDGGSWLILRATPAPIDAASALTLDPRI